MSNSRGPSTPERGHVYSSLTSPTNIYLERASSASDAIVEWQVVEFDGASVQRGTYNIDAEENSFTRSISSVDLSKSIVLYTTSIASNSGVHHHRGMWDAKFTSSTELSFSRNTTGTVVSVGGVLSWQVASFSEGSVQSGSFELTGTSVDVTISSVVLARSVVFHSYMSPVSNLDRAHGRVLLLNDTTLRFLRNNSNERLDGSWFVLEHPAFSVQKVERHSSSGVVITSVIDEVDTGLSFVYASGSQNTGGGTSYDNRGYTYWLEDSTSVQSQKQSSSQTTTLNFDVVELLPSEPLVGPFPTHRWSS